MRIRPDEISKIINRNSNRIPPIIHQTWKTDSIPLKFQSWFDSWAQFNDEFYHVVWSDDDIKKFIHSEYPEYVELYYSLRRPVEIADFFRYLVIFHYGGIYADLDVECCQSIAPLLAKENTFFCCLEKYAKNDFQKENYKLIRKEQMCQWFFGAIEGCKVLKDICDSINENYPRKYIADYSLISTMNNTGPGVFSDVVLDHKKKGANITIYPQYFFASGSCFTTGFDDEYPNWVEPDSLLYSKEELIFVKHHFEGSWKEEDKLENENMY